MHEHFVIPLFSTLWWQGILISTLFVKLVIIVGLRFNSVGQESLFRKGLLLFLLMRFILNYSYLFYAGQFTLQESLPLQLCSLGTVLSLVFLYKPTAALFEFLFLMSFIGAVVSIITPEMTHGYTHLLFWEYYISHSSLIAVPLYGFYVMGFRARPYSWLKFG